MTLVQHEATLMVGGRQVTIHAPPFVPESKLDGWLSETLKADGVSLVSKTWGSPTLSPNPESAA